MQSPFDKILQENVGFGLLTRDEAARLQSAVDNARTQADKAQAVMDLLKMLTARLQTATKKLKREVAYRSN